MKRIEELNIIACDIGPSDGFKAHPYTPKNSFLRKGGIYVSP
jgi:hypothetical protein